MRSSVPRLPTARRLRSAEWLAGGRTAILIRSALRQRGSALTAIHESAIDMTRAKGVPPQVAATMDDVARLAGVSKATVSRALAHSSLVNKETRKRVLNVVKRSGYRINKNAQRLRERRANAIAVVTGPVARAGHELAAPSTTPALLSDTVRALTLREKAVVLLPANAASRQNCQSMLAEKSVDGFVFLQSRDKELLSNLHALNVPFVAWDDDQAREPYCVVTGAARQAGRLAGQYLAGLGCTTTLFVHAAQDALAATRQSGLMAGMESGGCQGEIRSLVVDDSSPYGVCTAVRERHKTLVGVDAFVASGEPCTLGIAWAADGRDFPFGKQIPILGFGQFGLSERMPARVTAVEQGLAEAGALLVEKLLARLEGIDPVPTTLPVYLRRGGMA